MTRAKTYGDNAERQREYRKRRAVKLERLTEAEFLILKISKDANLESSQPGIEIDALIEEIATFVSKLISILPQAGSYETFPFKSLFIRRILFLSEGCLRIIFAAVKSILCPLELF